MAEMWMEVREFYWAHREAFRMACAGLVFLSAQIVILLWTLRRLGELSNIRERISRLADGLALLTDTTEAGLAALAAQVEQLNRAKGRVVKPAPRSTVQKRVKEAARRGERISRIAAHESLSESEVGLHLALSNRKPVAAASTVDVPLVS